MSTSNAFSQYYNPKSADSTKNLSESKLPPAPVEKKGWEWNKVYPGGNGSIGFNRNYFYIEVSPLAGYWVTNWFTPGLMFTYIYFTSKIVLRDPTVPTNVRVEDFSSSVVGLSPFARAFIIKWLFAHVETGFFYAKGINSDRDRSYYYGQESRIVFSPMVGGGINYAFGTRGGFTAMLLFNLNYDPTFITYGANQPFATRIGFYF